MYCTLVMPSLAHTNARARIIWLSRQAREGSFSLSARRNGYPRLPCIFQYALQAPCVYAEAAKRVLLCTDWAHAMDNFGTWRST